jgi:hypothetical protein
MAGSIEKRIEALEQRANSRAARQIILEVNGNVPADETAEAELLQSLAVHRHDMVIRLCKFVAVKGLPRIASVTSL